MAQSPERKRAYMKEYYRKHKEKRRIYNKQYHQKNRDWLIVKMKEWHDRNRDRVKQLQREWWLKRNWGLTIKQYDDILQKQGNGCAICGKKNRWKTAHVSLAVDHDHNTGEMRGLLCNRCNLCLGWFEDNQVVVLSYIGEAQNGI